MRYYIIPLLVIALIGCKKKDDTPKTLEQTIAKMQGVRLYKGTLVTINTDNQGNNTLDTQWLDNYRIQIHQLYENTITLRAIDGSVPSLTSSDALVPGADSTCKECVHFGWNQVDNYYGRTSDVTYNPNTDKVNRVHVSFTWASPGVRTMKSEVFELTEQKE